MKTSSRYWTTNQISELKELYAEGFLAGDGKLERLCLKVGRLDSNVCRKARELGLTILGRPMVDENKSKISARVKKWIAEKGHPRGMLGKTHSIINRNQQSHRFKSLWADPNNKLNSKEHRQFISNNSSRTMIVRLSKQSNVYSRCKKGTIIIGGKKIHVRSSWEANIAAYLEFLKTSGEIKDWKYEPETFWFMKIKRGVRSYKPDFKIISNDGSFYYEEVKGWLDAKSKTKIKRMEIYYPHIDLRLLNEKRYKAIQKMKGIIPSWGILD